MVSLSVFSCGPLATNAILVGCKKTGQAAVIDPAQKSFDSIVRAAKDENFSIEKVLLTHSHWDHIVDLALFVDRLAVPVFVHEADSENVRHPGSDGIPLLCPCQGIKEYFFLADGQTVKVGNLKLDVLHTPGHSPGSVSFYLAEQKIVISGDTLFKGSMGSLSLPGADPQAMWQSLRKLAKLPPEVQVYPGHGETTTIGAENWLERAEEIFS
ncbi:MAG: MBL fold metallo-hydrolase [Chlamydiota bacterium]